MHITSNAYHFSPTTFIMNSEQKSYIDGVNSTEDGIILIKDTGREGILLPLHKHRQTQVVMTMQGTMLWWRVAVSTLYQKAISTGSRLRWNIRCRATTVR